MSDEEDVCEHGIAVFCTICLRRDERRRVLSQVDEIIDEWYYPNTGSVEELKQKIKELKVK